MHIFLFPPSHLPFSMQTYSVSVLLVADIASSVGRAAASYAKGPGFDSRSQQLPNER